MRFKIYIFLIVALFITNLLSAQNNSHIIQVDKQGKMIWKDTHEEAFFWGVNYTTPFAHAFRQIARVGEDRKKAIDEDTYHFARLGINAYRIHVWDCEISDSIGNLLVNEHLDLFDYLIYRLQERGIYSFITPIAYWGNGYPEPDEDLPGFSRAFSKEKAYTDPKAIAAQERYLKQFVSHVNPYTGTAYKDDPMIVGFEVCNEPAHSKPKETTLFVRRMIAAIRSTGCKKPVFYNVTQNIRLLEDFIKGGTDGVTFQWYPTGLVAGHEQRGNFMPHVDKYDLPFQHEKYFQSQARLVYEFDAADIGRSYMYPPMAISFKEAGMQWATMFAYDPMAIAASNTEYQTHFLNMAYTPQKAIGFKIAGELFRNPRFQRDRVHETKSFEMNDVTIDYAKNLSELSTKNLFYYTNNTFTYPENPAELQSIAGYGTSPVVSYNGCGAYFLDKINDGIWRLEIMPDAVWVRDPFSPATPKIKNVLIQWNKNNMKIDLPDLGKSFSIIGVNKNNDYKAIADNGQFIVAPGTYLLSDKQIPDSLTTKRIGNIVVNEFVAPKENVEQHPYFVHSPVEMVSQKQALDVYVTMVEPDHSERKLTVQLLSNQFMRWRSIQPKLIPMEKVDPCHYHAVIPDSLVNQGILSYIITVEDNSGNEIVYPGGVKGPTTRWDYYNPDCYSVKVIPEGGAVQLFHAHDYNKLNQFIGNVNFKSIIKTSGITGGEILKFVFFESHHLSQGDEQPEVLYAFDNYIGDVIEGISKYTSCYSQLIIKGRALSKPVNVELGLVNKEGNAFKANITLTNDQNQQVVDLKSLTNGKMMLLPRPYPSFLPFWYLNKNSKHFDLGEIERIQFIIFQDGNDKTPQFELQSIVLK